MYREDIRDKEKAQIEEVMLAGYLYTLASMCAHMLSSLPLRHAQKINTSFHLINTNQQSPNSGDSVARKF